MARCWVSWSRINKHGIGFNALSMSTPRMRCSSIVQCPANVLLWALQIVVLDKMDYCASLNNLASVINLPNCKVGAGASMVTCMRHGLVCCAAKLHQHEYGSYDYSFVCGITTQWEIGYTEMNQDWQQLH